MYILTTVIYKTKEKTTTEFEKYYDAVIAAEHLVKVLNNVISLTRHSSCEEAVSHCGYYVDIYNELFICIKTKEE